MNILKFIIPESKKNVFTGTLTELNLHYSFDEHRFTSGSEKMHLQFFVGNRLL